MSGMKVLFTLIAINVIIFFIFRQESVAYEAMVLRISDLKQFKIWELVTCMFLHAGALHIIGNMYGVYLFGSFIAPELGGRRFFNLYFISGILGNLIFVAFNWNTNAGLVGASGALFGVILAAAMLCPDKEIMLIFFPVPFKLKTFAVVYIIFEIINEMSTRTIAGGLPIAHLAHLGGALGGYIYIKATYKGKYWDILGFVTSAFKSSGGSGKKKKAPEGWSVKSYDTYDQKEKKNKKVSPRELDRILDKISATGINSLTPEETEDLKRAREQMKKR